uniref:Acetolactate synthase n=1 Tax=Vischeria sp. CAUP Q 202 TaxID=1805947 RepID=A0A1D8RE06_9STRA|nr:acetohydroxyacid synthetase large subunit [Vischeria punctata]AOW70932.1 acetohydroxyacid synthetase large subunit [Vischeria sp. CAUP Q 202]UTV00941.1 acetohydroxyacid synthetase large subunit [Vischeria punctata]
MKIKKQIRRIHTGAFALLNSIIQNGGQVIFGYPGGAILPIYDELYLWEQENLIKHILVRHEQGAAHAADAYSRSTGKVGICFATSGPGATNLVTGIATADMDSIPMFIVTGQVGRAFIGTDAFQEVDIYTITKPIVKASYIIQNVNKISEIVSEAFYLAKNGRPGPVLIDIPKDVGLEEIISYIPIYQQHITRNKRYEYLFQTRFEQIRAALTMIQQSSQPLLYVGGGAVLAEARRELIALAEKFEIPVTTTLMGKGAFHENHCLCLGMLGMHGTAYANFAVSECDLLIAVGARFDDRVTGKLEDFASQSQILQIDIDPHEVGKNKIPHLAILGDIKKVLQQLLKHSTLVPSFDSTQTKFWRERIIKWKKRYPLIIPKTNTELSPQYIVNRVSELFPNAYFTTDVGQHQMWAAQFLKCNIRKWLSSAGLGTMGYGLPAAVGTQLAFPNSTVICISGDASFQMNLQELGTISQYKLPIKIFILNNRWQGMVRQWQQSFYDERYSHSSMKDGMPDFVMLAESYGIKSKRIQTLEDFLSIENELVTSNQPFLVDFQVHETENCYPMVAPGKSNSQMIGLTAELSSNLVKKVIS